MCRPVGLAFDAWGRLYVSADASGEIFRVRYANFSARTGPHSLGSRKGIPESVLALGIVAVTMALL